jgi:ABC-type transport system involved in multi-copper enzyme maturation permease subunit
MIWVTWRQHRVEALVAGIVLAVVALILLLTGREMISTYQTSGLASCSLKLLACVFVEENFINHFSAIVVFMGITLSTLPLLLGMFIGAPLISRELEQRTHRLVWTQSISRGRWLGTKLLLLISVTLLAFIALAALSAWWSGPWVAVQSLWSTYDFHGILLPIYSLFAFALGVAAGITVRRSVPAMGITIVLFVLLRVVIAFWLRPYFLPPLISLSVVDQPGPPSHTDWTIHIGTIDRSGQELTDIQIGQICPQLNGNGSAQAFAAFTTCEHDHGFQSRSFYQPVERYWLFQGIEAAIFLILALVLLASSTWLASKKIT